MPGDGSVEKDATTDSAGSHHTRAMQISTSPPDAIARLAISTFVVILATVNILLYPKCTAPAVLIVILFPPLFYNNGWPPAPVRRPPEKELEPGFWIAMGCAGLSMFPIVFMLAVVFSLSDGLVQAGYLLFCGLLLGGLLLVLNVALSGRFSDLSRLSQKAVPIALGVAFLWAFSLSFYNTPFLAHSPISGILNLIIRVTSFPLGWISFPSHHSNAPDLTIFIHSALMIPNTIILGHLGAAVVATVQSGCKEMDTKGEEIEDEG